MASRGRKQEERQEEEEENERPYNNGSLKRRHKRRTKPRGDVNGGKRKRVLKGRVSDAVGNRGGRKEFQIAKVITEDSENTAKKKEGWVVAHQND